MTHPHRFTAFLILLHQFSPLRYTVPNKPTKKPKKHKEEKNYYLPPELGDNPSTGLKMQAFFFKIVSSFVFEGLIIACISINTILMASEHYDMDTTYKTFLDICNYVSETSIRIFFVCGEFLRVSCLNPVLTANDL